ncbi:MAG: hypothetical protein ACK40G_00045 [Cytophagaceae bacterium]
MRFFLFALLFLPVISNGQNNIDQQCARDLKKQEFAREIQRELDKTRLACNSSNLVLYDEESIDHIMNFLFDFICIENPEIVPHQDYKFPPDIVIRFNLKTRPKQEFQYVVIDPCRREVTSYFERYGN